MNIFPKVFEKLYLFLSPKSNIAAVHSKSGVLQGTLGFVRISRIVTYIFRILYPPQFPRKYKIKCSEKSISFHKNQIPVQTEVVIFMGNVSSKGYTVAFRIRNVHLREKIGSTDPFKTRKSLRFYGVSFRLILVPERVQEWELVCSRLSCRSLSMVVSHFCPNFLSLLVRNLGFCESALMADFSTHFSGILEHEKNLEKPNPIQFQPPRRLGTELNPLGMGSQAHKKCSSARKLSLKVHHNSGKLLIFLGIWKEYSVQYSLCLHPKTNNYYSGNSTLSESGSIRGLQWDKLKGGRKQMRQFLRI